MGSPDFWFIGYFQTPKSVDIANRFTTTGGQCAAKPGGCVSAHTPGNCCFKSWSRVPVSGFVSAVESGRAKRHSSDREAVKLSWEMGAKEILVS